VPRAKQGQYVPAPRFNVCDRVVLQGVQCLVVDRLDDAYVCCVTDNRGLFDLHRYAIMLVPFHMEREMSVSTLH
jgi:hypothetical protein